MINFVKLHIIDIKEYFNNQPIIKGHCWEITAHFL